jgi:hypothetical protein
VTELPLASRLAMPIGGSVIRTLTFARHNAGVTTRPTGAAQPRDGYAQQFDRSEAYTLAIFRALRRFAGSGPVAAHGRARCGDELVERASLRLLVPLLARRLTELAGVDRLRRSSITARQAAPTVSLR